MQYYMCQIKNIFFLCDHNDWLCIVRVENQVRSQSWKSELIVEQEEYRSRTHERWYGQHSAILQENEDCDTNYFLFHLCVFL